MIRRHFQSRNIGFQLHVIHETYLLHRNINNIDTIADGNATEFNNKRIIHIYHLY